MLLSWIDNSTHDSLILGPLNPVFLLSGKNHFTCFNE